MVRDAWPSMIQEPARRRMDDVSTTRRPLFLLLPALLLLATACGSDDGDGDGAGAAGNARTVTIAEFEFAPEVLEVKVGDTVTVDNKDTAEHTVTAKDKSFDTGRFARGTKTFTVTKAGRFEYVCEVHPFMASRFIQVAA